MQRVFIICVFRKIDTRMKNFASISSDAIQFLNCLHFRFYQIFWYSGQTTCKRHIFTLFRMMRVTLFRIALRLCCYFTISNGIVEVSFKDLNRLKSSQSVVHIFSNFETGFHPSKWFEMSCHIEESSWAVSWEAQFSTILEI